MAMQAQQRSEDSKAFKKIAFDLCELCPPMGPGIAKSARWIYSHAASKKETTTAYCRVDTDRAWLSYSTEHVTSTRWSCKNRADLQSATLLLSTIAAKHDAHAFFRCEHPRPHEFPLDRIRLRV